MTPEPPTAVVWDLADESDTEQLGQRLAAALPECAVVGLTGTLGAGKTRLVQAIAAASGLDSRDVVSPTFVLMQEHHGNRSIYHLDAYRIRDDDEFWNLGVDEYFDGPGLVLIEWADRVRHCLPADRLEIDLAVLPGSSRRATITAFGARYEPVVAALACARRTDLAPEGRSSAEPPSGDAVP